MNRYSILRPHWSKLLLLGLFACASGLAQPSVSLVGAETVNAQGLQGSTRPLTLEDIMHYQTLKLPQLSDNGQLLAVEAKPDRGESQVLIKPLGHGEPKRVKGSKPQVNADGSFVLISQEPSLLERETLEKAQLTTRAVLLDSQTGTEQVFEHVKQARFSPDGAYALIWFEEDKTKTEHKIDNDIHNEPDGSIAPNAKPSSKLSAKSKAATSANTKTAKADKELAESELLLIRLTDNKQHRFSQVSVFAMGENAKGLLLAQGLTDCKDGKDSASETLAAKCNGQQLLFVDFASFKITPLFNSNTHRFGALALADDLSYGAFTLGNSLELRSVREYQLHRIDIASGQKTAAPKDTTWLYNQYSSLVFSQDNQRLFVGRVPNIRALAQKPKLDTQAKLFDKALIQANSQGNVWHGDDRKIKPHEIHDYEKSLKKTYLGVWHMSSERLLQIANEQLPEVKAGQQSRFLLASSDIPYQKMITWAGFFRDWSVVNLNTGKATEVLVQHPSDSPMSLSPDGKQLIYFKQGQIWLYSLMSQRHTNLSAKIATPFSDEDHDYPSAAPGYGFGPWLADSSAVLVYDKYDIWQFSSQGSKAINLTNAQGRKQQLQLRVKALVNDKSRQAVVNKGDTLLLQGYNERTKADGFYQAKVGKTGLSVVVEGDHKLTVLARSKNTGQFLFSKERFDLYPDLYSADINAPATWTQQTFLAKQQAPFTWGNAELVQWTNDSGKRSDGVLIKPTHYQAGKAYPVIVYFYRFMSDRLHDYPDMAINHRPNFAWYADNGYAIFLPDIRFEEQYPGLSAVKALTSGVQHLIDMGIAKADAIGLHGHSWGGYQTAFAVTQTPLFKAAVAGAPVANMTSAYSGIRHGSGLARQFQYETGQSRMGQSLMDIPLRYMENSPVFYVKRVTTPLMIMFGDKDDAVPWEQGVELYLAMRRAGKAVVFLQYEDEPHHLKKYPNKLDYSIKMMQYFDHYLKGLPAPDWLKQGQAYQEYRD
ncbi:peptidase S9, prolyl oligopeptidase active site region [Shewanella denitrificans OS217]|uniref:Peptidase S9, prolyl oligopeptidase active site region n=1 Tax=Shewanella denitrificans (strain OS217 / ATCC BAA-1090 / DSM 15013) TaxID=318161 RepID=Q12L37_SHEDO|nr:prolyl oligopeptidase family serine peptidase [Shewanella denitrificans]ABE55839.1 peptidase S9, prolyl oligopeptidase active site region [Shewanella denitrificans OS217]